MEALTPQPSSADRSDKNTNGRSSSKTVTDTIVGEPARLWSLGGFDTQAGPPGPRQTYRGSCRGVIFSCAFHYRVLQASMSTP